jgi:hypothetical protein
LPAFCPSKPKPGLPGTPALPKNPNCRPMKHQQFQFGFFGNFGISGNSRYCLSGFEKVSAQAYNSFAMSRFFHGFT